MQEKLVLVFYLRETEVKLLFGLFVLYLEPSIHVCFVDLKVLKIYLKQYLLLFFLTKDEFIVKGKDEAGIDFLWRIRFILLLFLSIGDVPTGDGDFFQELMEVLIELFFNIFKGLFRHSSI